MLTRERTTVFAGEITDLWRPAEVDIRCMEAREAEFDYNGQHFTVEAKVVAGSQVSPEMWHKIQQVRSAYAVWGEREDKNKELLDSPDDYLADTKLFLTTVKSEGSVTYFHMTARPALQRGYRDLPIELQHWVVVSPNGAMPLAHVVDAQVPLTQLSVLSRASTITEMDAGSGTITETELRNRRAIALAATFSLLLETDQQDSAFLLQLASKLRDQSFVFTDENNVAHNFSFPETSSTLALPSEMQVQIALHDPEVRSQIEDLFTYWPGYWWGENFAEVALQAYTEHVLTDSHLQSIHDHAKLNGRVFETIDERIKYLASPRRRKAWTTLFEEDRQLFTYLFERVDPQPYSSMYNREQLLFDISTILPIDWLQHDPSSVR